MNRLGSFVGELRLNSAARLLVSQSNTVKRLLALSLDSAIVLSAFGFAWYLRADKLPPFNKPLVLVVIFSVLTTLSIFHRCGMYRAVQRYTGWADFVLALRASLWAGLFISVTITFYGINGVPRAIGLLASAMIALLVPLSRLATQWILTYLRFDRAKCSETKRMFIYGAGSAGLQLLAGIGPGAPIDFVGFIDDDTGLAGRTIAGRPVFSAKDLRQLCQAHGVSTVVLAMPSVSKQRRAQIVRELRNLKLTVQSLPALEDLLSGRGAVTDLRDVDVVDLLGRLPVQPISSLLSGTIDGKSVLITGAGGSIGGEICRQILHLHPREIILIEHSEYALYSIHEELRRIAPPEVVVHAVLGSICDVNRMTEVFDRHRPETVYHAAAYKHVPLVEGNVCEAIRNNVFGTLTTSRVALRSGCHNFVLISTDKAVRPTSVMGATKRLAELVLQAQASSSSSTLFSMVRFGNVLGSSGSVIPLFQSQISAGGPITVTDSEITRYFMTIPEASQLVLQAATMAVGGDVFLLDMGEPMKIIDLARSMIELSGLRVRDGENPDGNISIEVTGLRPGEKLYEELLIDAEAIPTEHPRIFRARERHLKWCELVPALSDLEDALGNNDTKSALLILERLIEGFVPRLPDSGAPSAARYNMTVNT